MFDTPEKAALAYNQKSKELFGDDGKQNIIKTPERPIDQEVKSIETRTGFFEQASNSNRTTEG
jgi:hypothetical protein